ncbi:MAG: ysG [Caulobacteraceae bacterium]|nr:ysG [Caulobacteraceae bacterium]
MAFAGAGEALEAKLRLFDGSPASIVKLDGEAALDPLRYQGARMAFISHPDIEFRDQAVAAARAAGVWVNVVDNQALSDFFTGAMVDRGVLVIGISTTGRSPLLAVALRRRIEARLHHGIGKVAAIMSWLREEVGAAAKSPARRRALLRAALDGEAAALAEGGDMDAAADILRQAMSDTPPAGRVAFIDGSGPADLISLRILRALSGADAILADPGVDPTILDLARREAVRLAAGADLAALAQSGEHVVRLTDGAPDASEIVALDHQGVETVILRLAPL